MADEMFFTNDNSSLRRGHRRASRTATFRPCHVWPVDQPERKLAGVVVDMTPFGLCIRMVEALAPGTRIAVQFMRDETFAAPMAAPIEGLVVRSARMGDGITDHGVQLQHREIRRSVSVRPYRPARPRLRRLRRSGVSSRMHTTDITLGDRGDRRNGR